MRALIIASLGLNIAVLVPVCFGLITRAGWTLAAYGPARRSGPTWAAPDPRFPQKLNRIGGSRDAPPQTRTKKIIPPLQQHHFYLLLLVLLSVPGVLLLSVWARIYAPTVLQEMYNVLPVDLQIILILACLLFPSIIIHDENDVSKQHKYTKNGDRDGIQDPIVNITGEMTRTMKILMRIKVFLEVKLMLHLSHLDVGNLQEDEEEKVTMLQSFITGATAEGNPPCGPYREF
jgi:hypothetical protein